MSSPAVGLLMAATAAGGAYLLWSSFAVERPADAGSPGRQARRWSMRRAVTDWLLQAGLDEVKPAEFAAVMAVLFAIGMAVAWALFNGVVPALAAGVFAASFPVATYRRRRGTQVEKAHEAWPRMIEEIRILTGSLGRSIPQSLFEVGRRGPIELRPAFAAAHREWLLSTDFERTVHVLKGRLADPTADAACETLLVAHELGGTDLGRRLLALAEDRSLDVQGRKDARAKQAGVRFARKFVLFVPLGMALAGLSIGDGRDAYATPFGQLLVTAAIGLMIGCWLWAGRLLRLPEEERVFRS